MYCISKIEKYWQRTGQPSIIYGSFNKSSSACLLCTVVHACCVHTPHIQIAQTVLLIETPNQRSSCHSIMAFYLGRPLTVVPNRFLFFYGRSTSGVPCHQVVYIHLTLSCFTWQVTLGQGVFYLVVSSVVLSSRSLVSENS